MLCAGAQYCFAGREALWDPEQVQDLGKAQSDFQLCACPSQPCPDQRRPEPSGLCVRGWVGKPSSPDAE